MRKLIIAHHLPNTNVATEANAPYCELQQACRAGILPSINASHQRAMKGRTVQLAKHSKRKLNPAELLQITNWINDRLKREFERSPVAQSAQRPASEAAKSND